MHNITVQPHKFSMLGTLSIPQGASLRHSATSHQKMPKRQVSCAAVAEERRRNPAESLYEVLQVKHDASVGEIKRAYRTLAKLYHPDVSEEGEVKDFIEISQAYARLSDPEARAEYDISMSFSSLSRRRPAATAFYTTRRWETDQCW